MKALPLKHFAFGKHRNYFASYTINVQRFPWLNIRSFSPMKFFAGILLQSLASSVYCLITAKHSLENFHGTLKMRKPRMFTPANLSIFIVYSYIAIAMANAMAAAGKPKFIAS